MDSKPDDDYLPVPEGDHHNLEDFSSETEEDEEMDDFNTTLPEEPDASPAPDEGDVVESDHGDVD